MYKLLIVFVLNLLISTITLGQNSYLLIGTYTAKGSEGVYLYSFDEKTVEIKPVSVVKGIKNPSFLAISPDKKLVYVVEEVANGKVNAYRFDKKTGAMTLLNTQEVNGDYPCHVAIDKTGKWVMVGNYGSGNFSIFPVQADGSLGKASQTIKHEGSSINKQRQEAPHVHSINIGKNNKDVFVVDLGIDKIMSYQLDSKTGKITTGNPPFIEVAQGSGPRHFAFHPNKSWAYVILELNSSITTFQYGDDGKLSALQTISTLPTGFSGANSCADIHVSPDGKFLYASNRGHDSIAVYKIDPKTGMLTLIQHQSVMGKTPRNFAITPSGNFVLVANQDSYNLAVFRRDRKTGKLTYTDKQIKVSMPVCVKVLGR